MNIVKLRVCNFDHKICWAIFVFLQLFIIACMVGSLGTKSWVKLDISDGLGEDFQSFEGSIMEVTHYNGDDIEVSYKDAADYYCDPNPNVMPNLYNAWCDMFDNLRRGFGVFAVFEIISIGCLVAWGAVLIGFVFSVNCLPCSFCCSACSWIAHFIAFFSWLAVSNGDYDGNCNDIAESFDDGDYKSDLKPPRLCIRDGPILATFLAVFLPIVVIAYIPIGCIAYRNKRQQDREGEKQEFALEIPNSLQIQNGGQTPIIVQGYPVIQAGVPYGSSLQEPIQNGIPYPLNGFNMQPTPPGQNSYPTFQKTLD
ncbi:unnamed protein product [Blepharisma stoltei]|uniref:Uncharacterized protein n=1 Tax=Blepharisma stoltei TaxID=1481888 RepID=A0AAU9K5M4_9CILI|nr:unnamed protein product [Blepharisma stoltei]